MLVSLSDMKDYLGIVDNSYDTFLTEQLTLISSAVENYCGRKFADTNYTQTYYISDFEEPAMSKLVLYHFPIVSITHVKEITSYVTGDVEVEVTANSQYRPQPDYGFLHRVESGRHRPWFVDMVGDAKIEVNYNAGYATIPPEIDMVVKALVTERYNKNVSGVELNFGSDVQRISVPGTLSIDFDYTLQANERKVRFGVLLGNYVNILDHFRSERVIVGSVKENYVS
jgi:hypothetical protein